MKAERVEPSAKSHSVAGAATPTVSVEPCQLPVAKDNPRSTTPGTGSTTRAATETVGPTAALTSISVTFPAAKLATAVVWPESV